MAGAQPMGLLALCCALVGAGSQSLTSCGNATDHLSKVKLSLSPDPIARGIPFTVVVTGSLDEDHTGGTVHVDLEVRALGVVDRTVRSSTPYTLSPGLLKGDQTIVVGPVTLPRDAPGDLVVKGRVRVANAKGEPVACVELNIDAPLASAAQVAASDIGARLQLTGGASCAAPTDHLKNISHKQAGGVTTLTGTLDEDLAALVVEVDLTVHALFVKIPLKLAVPVSYTPGLRKGDWKAVAGTPSSAVAPRGTLARRPVWVSGEVILSDAKGEEVTCIPLTGGAAVATAGSLGQGQEQPFLV